MATTTVRKRSAASAEGKDAAQGSPGSARASQAPGATPGGARKYDFRKPTGLARSHLRDMHLLLEVFTHRVGGALTAGLATPIHTALGGMDEQTWDEYSSSLPEPTAVVSLALPPLQGRLFVHVPLDLAMAFVDLRLGGRPSGFKAERPLTDIEQELVSGVIATIVSELPPAFAGLAAFRTGPLSIVQGVRFLQGPSATEMCLVAFLEISGGERWSGTLSICATLGTLRPIIDAMVAQELEGDDTSDAAQARLVESLVESVPVELSLRFPSFELTPVDLLALEVGDVVPLDYERDQPLVVETGGRTLLWAVPTSKGRRLACVIVEPEERFP